MTNVLKIVLTLAFLALACSPVKVLDSIPSPVPEDVVVSTPSEVALVTLPDTAPAVEVAVDPIKVVAPHVEAPFVNDTKPKSTPVAVVGRTTYGTQYSNCASGNFGPVSNGRPRLFGRFR